MNGYELHQKVFSPKISQIIQYPAKIPPKNENRHVKQEEEAVPH